MRDGAEGRTDACRKMRNVSATAATQERDDAHRQQRKLDLKSEPFFRTPKLLWVSGRLRRRRGMGRVASASQECY